MFTVIFILWGSATVGYLLRRHPIPGLERLMTYTVWGLLFLMGVEVGGNPTLMQALDRLGWEALILTLCTALGLSLIHIFQVRTARVSIEGKVAPVVAYKAEIDLSDEGKIKMLDAYTRLSPLKGFDFTIGQMRVPFTIDAHRSPHQQYFANRSFIAKQVGNVRDVGATLGYKIGGPLPLTLQAGMFNGRCV